MEQLDSYYQYYKNVDGTILIEIKLQEIMQIYDSLDPSPFYQKVLDRNAEEYITEAVMDFPAHILLKLVVYLPEKEMQKEAARELDQAIHNHFKYKTNQTQRELREKFMGGRMALIIGVVFLASTLAANIAIASQPDNVINQVIRSSLLIIGWVAMWQPVNTFLYEWWPIRRKIKVYRKIGSMEVSIVPY
ncbi:MAG: hypothetical protein LUO93_07105 [Methanomicrobiales archaeon]|nr:hypothetical protein [Methanomicrobiales archaeon]